MRWELSFPIEKVDARRRVVGGWAMTETVDRQRDLIPYDTAVRAFERFAEESGAVREMHQPRAVGKLVGWQADPERRGVYAEVYLSESRDGQDALTKVMEGVLKGFSIGGYATSWRYSKASDGRDVRVLDDLTIVELSLVDVPANPEAKVVVVKAQDLDAPLNHVPPGEPEPQPVSPSGEGLPDRADVLGEARVLGAQPDATPTQRPTPQPVQKDDQDALLEQARARAKRYGISVKDDGHRTPPKGYPEDPEAYGDPVNYRYPVDRSRWRAAISYFNQTEHQRQGGYSDAEWAIIGRRIARLASRISGTPYRYDPKTKQIVATRKEAAMEVQKAASDMLEQIRSALSGALSSLEEGDAQAVRDALSQAIAALDVTVDEVSDLESSSSEMTTIEDAHMVSTPSTRSTMTASTPSTRSPMTASTPSTRSTATAPTQRKAETVSPRTVSLEEGPSAPTASVPTAPSSALAKEELAGLIRQEVAAVLREVLTARPEPAVAAVPRAEEPALSPIAKALMQNDLREAIRLAGDDRAMLYDAAQETAQALLRKVFRAASFSIDILNPEDLA